MLPTERIKSLQQVWRNVKRVDFKTRYETMKFMVDKVVQQHKYRGIFQ